MRTEAQVISFLEEANPVQDLTAIDARRSEVSTYIVSLRRRESHTRGRGSLRSSVRLGVAMAAIALVILAAGAFLLILNTQPEVAGPDPEMVIDQFLSAQDFETLAAVLTPDALRGYRDQSEQASAESFNEDLIRQEIAAHEILGIQYAIESCAPSYEIIIRCEISYRSNIRNAFGEPPLIETHTFYVEDGLISTGTENFGMGFDTYASREASGFSLYVNEIGLVGEMQASCPSLRDVNPVCATFIMNHLEDFVAWGLAAGHELE